MLDLIFILVTVGFFALCEAYAVFFDHQMGGTR